MGNPAEELAEFITTVTFDHIPDQAVQIAERCFVDTIGVAIAGSSAAAGEIARRTYLSMYSAGPSTVIGSASTLPEPEATFLNGTASHALDYDDVTAGMDGHPSPPIVAPILSLAESLNLTGQDMITAYIVGFETQCYIAAPNLRGRTGPGLHENGWHPTAIFGTFGATAAAAYLLDLPYEDVCQALNIAVSMPAGVKHNFGSLSKPLQVGQAGAAGIRAARLAENGFTAIEDALWNGFFPVYASVDDLDTTALYPLGERWAILDEGVDIKKYPACYAGHTSIFAAQELVAQHDIDPEEVTRVHVAVNPQMQRVLVHDNPQTEAEAKFSVPYPVACAIVFDYIGIESFEPETITDPLVQQVRERITWELDESLPSSSRTSTVTIEFNDGKSVSSRVNRPPATHDNPLSGGELKEKFVECATRTISKDAAEVCFEELYSLRTVTDISRISEQLRR
jgi:2-methylcitrate dehydratase PrpD